MLKPLNDVWQVLGVNAIVSTKNPKYIKRDYCHHTIRSFLLRHGVKKAKIAAQKIVKW